MPSASTEPPIRTLRDARACLDAGLAALGAVADWMGALGYETLAADARRVVATAGWAVSLLLDWVRDAHPELDERASDDEDEGDLP